VRTSIAIVLLGAVVTAQTPAAQVAPMGTLRAVFLGGNPVQGRVDAKTGEASGVVPDFARELARKLEVPLSIVSAPDAARVIAALTDGTADIGFLAFRQSIEHAKLVGVDVAPLRKR
jgi:ABC-type amino acid transport substrate-binding protein